MNKRKGRKQQTMIYKTLHRKLKIEGGDVRCFGKVSSSCSTCGTRRVTLATNEWCKHSNNELNICEETISM